MRERAPARGEGKQAWPGRGRRRLDRRAVAEEDRAVAALVFLNATAKLHQIFIGVDDAALDGLRGSRVVSAIVERHPTPLELLALQDLRPGHATAHGADLPRDLSSYTPALGGVKEWVWHNSHN